MALVLKKWSLSEDNAEVAEMVDSKKVKTVLGHSL